MVVIDIAGISVGIDLPENLISESFYKFRTEAAAGRPDIRVCLGTPDDIRDIPGKDFTDHDTDFCLTRIERERIRAFFHEDTGWLGLSVIMNGDDPRVICVPDPDSDTDSGDPEVIFDLMKGGVFLLLRMFGIVVLHSASIIFKEKVFAFSAPSGTGKTTHAELWRRYYKVPYFNGDMLAIRLDDEKPRAYGLPWSGESGISTTGSMELGGLFFLERGTSDEVVPVDGIQKLLLITQGLLSVNYDSREFSRNATEIERVAAKLPCAVLKCTMNKSAADTVKEFIEKKM